MPLTPLSPIQVKALNLLLQGETITGTARQLNLHRSTIHEWSRNHPAFTVAYHAAHQRHQADVLDRYHSLAGESLTFLQSLLADGSTPQSLRLRAALAVLQSVETKGPAIPFTPHQEHQLDELIQQIPTESDTSAAGACAAAGA